MPSDSVASETKTLKVGDTAPDFTLPKSDRSHVVL